MRYVNHPPDMIVCMLVPPVLTLRACLSRRLVAAMATCFGMVADSTTSTMPETAALRTHIECARGVGGAHQPWATAWVTAWAACARAR